LPKIDVKDGKWTGDGPRVGKFCVAAKAVVGSNAVSTRVGPFFDVLSNVRPKESGANAVECFEEGKMTGSRGSMESTEDVVTEGGRDDNKGEEGARLDGLKDEKAAVLEVEAVITEKWAVGGIDFVNVSSRPG
jgi:hypothetical protein